MSCVTNKASNKGLSKVFMAILKKGRGCSVYARPAAKGSPVYKIIRTRRGAAAIDLGGGHCDTQSMPGTAPHLPRAAQTTATGPGARQAAKRHAGRYDRHADGITAGAGRNAACLAQEPAQVFTQLGLSERDRPRHLGDRSRRAGPAQSARRPPVRTRIRLRPRPAGRAARAPPSPPPLWPLALARPRPSTTPPGAGSLYLLTSISYYL